MQPYSVQVRDVAGVLTYLVNSEKQVDFFPSSERIAFKYLHTYII